MHSGMLLGCIGSLLAAGLRSTSGRLWAGLAASPLVVFGPAAGQVGDNPDRRAPRGRLVPRLPLVLWVATPGTHPRPSLWCGRVSGTLFGWDVLRRAAKRFGWSVDVG